jgi:hypothetical protein
MEPSLSFCTREAGFVYGLFRGLSPGLKIQLLAPRWCMSRLAWGDGEGAERWGKSHPGKGDEGTLADGPDSCTCATVISASPANADLS